MNLGSNRCCGATPFASIVYKEVANTFVISSPDLDKSRGRQHLVSLPYTSVGFPPVRCCQIQQCGLQGGPVEMNVSGSARRCGCWRALRVSAPLAAANRERLPGISVRNPSKQSSSALVPYLLSVTLSSRRGSRRVRL